MLPSTPTKLVLAVAMAVTLAACSDGETISPAPAACVTEAPEALRACVDTYSAGIAACFDDGGQGCGDDDPTLRGALDALSSTVGAACESGLGTLDAEGTIQRLRHACSSQAQALSWRTHGGPHGAVWADAEAADRACLTAAHARAAALVTESLAAIHTCLDGESCDATALDADGAKLDAVAVLLSPPLSGTLAPCWWNETSAILAMRANVSTLSTGHLPLALSPESITPSTPSRTALATSLTSARVGRGL